MDIVSIGGGPAGLFFGILQKRCDPASRVRVLERNRPDDTFGWGVVFSDETLGNILVSKKIAPLDCIIDVGFLIITLFSKKHRSGASFG